MKRLLRKLLLALGYLLAGASLTAFLSGSTCIYSYGSHCDDDDDHDDDGGLDDDHYDDDFCDDDDDNGVSSSPARDLPSVSLLDAGDEVFRVRIERMALSEDGAGRRIEVADGLSLFAFEGVHVAAEADVLAFARRVLRANAELLGWTPAERLVSERVVTTAQRLVAELVTVEGGRVLVELELSGRLLALEHRRPAPR